MSRHFPSALFCTIALLALAFAACSKDDAVNPTISDNIKTGSTVTAGQGSVSPGGAPLVLDTAAGPLAGFSIEAPAGSLTDSRSVKVTYETITSHNLGSQFNPISPLVHIQIGAGDIAMPVTITIPAAIPANHFAMIFAYEKSSGTLEAMPFVSSDGKSVTTMTKNFGTTGVGKSLAKGAGANGVLDWFFVVSSTEIDALDQGNFETGFRPGQDDWIFDNMGSMLEPEGHCAGQTEAAIWYYLKRSEQQGHLYGKYDNFGGAPTPWLWQDDVHAYRLCTVVQQDANWEASSEYMAKVNMKHSSLDRQTLRSFAYAISVTKEPQLMHIWRTDNNTHIGHAIIVYRKTGNTLMVADPNFHGKRDRSVSLSGEIFESYSSGPNVNNLNMAFLNMRHLGITACINSSRMETLWGELEARTVGDDRFPSTAMKVMDDNADFVDLKDGFTKTGGEITLLFPGGMTGFKVDSVFDFDTQARYLVDANRFNVPTGKHKIGLYFTNTAGNWAGFRWVDVEIKGSTWAWTIYLDGKKMDPVWKSCDYVEVGPSSLNVGLLGYHKLGTSDASISIILNNLTSTGTYNLNASPHQGVLCDNWYYYTDDQNTGTCTITEFTHNKQTWETSIVGSFNYNVHVVDTAKKYNKVHNLRGNFEIRN